MAIIKRLLDRSERPNQPEWYRHELCRDTETGKVFIYHESSSGLDTENPTFTNAEITLDSFLRKESAGQKELIKLIGGLVEG